MHRPQPAAPVVHLRQRTRCDSSSVDPLLHRVRLIRRVEAVNLAAQLIATAARIKDVARPSGYAHARRFSVIGIATTEGLVALDKRAVGELELLGSKRIVLGPGYYLYSAINLRASRSDPSTTVS